MNSVTTPVQPTQGEDNLYRPSLLPPVIVDYGWTGSPTPAVLKQRTW